MSWRCAGRGLGPIRRWEIATSLDGGKIWITVTGHLAGITNAMGAVLELPAFP